MWACNCLNIIIQTGDNDVHKVVQDEFSEEELNDIFFKQEILQCDKNVQITKVHPNLVSTRQVGAWKVFHCTNCDVQSHAIHREMDNTVLIFSNLLRDEAINNVKASDLFSTIFNIAVFSNDIEFEDKLLNNVTYLPTKETEKCIQYFSDLMKDYIHKETINVEEKIRQFTEEQYDYLNNLKMRAVKEHNALIKNITDHQQSKPNSTNKTNLPASPGGKNRLTEQIGSNTSPRRENVGNITKHSPNKRQKNTSQSFDSEGVFSCDGFDDMQENFSEPEESDNEVYSREEVVPIQRNKAHSISIAKSLPMNIPHFMAHDKEDLDDGGVVDKSVDIAASIQALARSVHGDTIGDVPRPRFSTEI